MSKDFYTLLLRYEHALCIGVLLVAAHLRFADIGAEPFFDDQAKISVQALNLSHRNEWSFLGPEMSTGGIRHSPFTNYLYAVPFSLTPDPRIARVFTGMANLLAIAIAYLIGRQFFGRKTAFVSAALYALYPAAVKGSRFLWNQNLAAPFVMLFLLTTLMGYYRNKKTGRIAHLPMLCLAGQCHPTLFLLFPVAIMCWTHAWRHRTHTRRHLCIQTASSSVLALALMTPWLIGIQQVFAATGHIYPIATGSNPGLKPMIEIMYGVVAGVFSVYGDVRPHSPNILQDNPSQPGLVGLTVAAASWFIVAPFLRRAWLPGLVVALGFLLVPALVLVFDIAYWHHHIWPLTGFLAVMQGALLGGTAAPRVPHQQPSTKPWHGLLGDRILRWPSLVFFSIVCGHLIYLHATYDPSEGVHSLEQNLASLDYGLQTAEDSAKELILLALNDPDYRCPGCPGWEALHLLKGIPLRVIWDGYPLPLPSEGALLMGVTNYDGRPFVFSGGHVISDWFRLVTLPPAMNFLPDIVPLDPVRFSNGATILGFLRDNPSAIPRASQPWTVHMIWHGETPPSRHGKFFAHLLDASGRVHSQQDPPTLPADQWRPRELVMTQLNLDPDELLPPEGPLYIRFGMYDQDGQAQVLNISGDPIGSAGLIQIRGSQRPTQDWGTGLTLDSIDTNSPLQQGTPLNVTAVWFAHQKALSQTSLRWSLTAPDGTIAFDGITDLLLHAPATILAADTFVTEQYTLRIPRALDPGTYQLEMQPYSQNELAGGDSFRASVEILPRYRSFDLPPMKYTVGAVFGQQIKLAGYDLERDERLLNLTLHWQALDQINIDYKYFVHVWMADRVVAQQDAMPSSNRYPTSWWAPGEVFSDPVEISLANLDPGIVTLTVGLYNPTTGARLPPSLAPAIHLSQTWVTLQTLTID